MLAVSEEEIINRAQRGDVQAVGTLYDLHHERIYRYVWSRVGQQRLAEDLTGEVFARMVANLPDYRPVGQPFQAWLYRIAHNLIADHYRQDGGNEMMSLDGMVGIKEMTESPDAVVERVLTAERIQKALDRLDPTQREVVVLRFLVGLPLQEVAAAIGKTVAATKSLQHRGLTYLRLELQQIRG